MNEPSLVYIVMIRNPDEGITREAAPVNQLVIIEGLFCLTID